MRLKTLITTAILLAIISSSSAIAAVKNGGTCTKVGALSTSGGITFKCSLVLKKKVWVKNSKAIPSSPASVINKTSTSTPTPSPTPFQPTSLDDLVAHPESMPYWAWKRSSDVIKSSQAEIPEVVIHVGPNTKLNHSLTETAILKTTKLYSEFVQPKTVHAIYYTFKDAPWAQREFAKYALRPMGNEAGNSCRSETTCWGGMAEINLKGSAILLFGVLDSGNNDSNHTTGSLESHEFTHAIQGSQFVGTQKESNAYCCTPAYMPWWMVEGGAEFSQAVSTFPNSYKAYLEERVRDTNQFLANRENKFTITWISKFLEPSARSLWEASSNDGRIYDVGYLANEAFVALKGPGISMQLFRDVALGSSWQEAFAKNFEQSWDDALPVLAKAIKAQLDK